MNTVVDTPPTTVGAELSSADESSTASAATAYNEWATDDGSEPVGHALHDADFRVSRSTVQRPTAAGGVLTAASAGIVVPRPNVVAEVKVSKTAKVRRLIVRASAACWRAVKVTYRQALDNPVTASLAVSSVLLSGTVGLLAMRESAALARVESIRKTALALAAVNQERIDAAREAANKARAEWATAEKEAARLRAEADDWWPFW